MFSGSARAQLLITYHLDMEAPTKWQTGVETSIHTPSYPYSARTGTRVGTINSSQAGKWRDMSAVTDLPPKPFRTCAAGLWLRPHHYASDIWMTLFEYPSGRVIKDVKLDSQINVQKLNEYQHFAFSFDRPEQDQVMLRIGYWGNGLVSFLMIDDGYVQCL